MVTETPLQIQVGDLLKRVGSQRDFGIVATLSGLVLGLTTIGDGEPITIALSLERIAEGVVVRGDLATSWAAPCARCLNPTGSSINVDVDELFETEPIPGETYLLDGEILDLEPLVRDALVLELPQAPLCSADCAGLCPNCGIDRNTATCQCEADHTDPRWAALGSLDL